MKKQYLGDSKDSFKWDYLDFLMKEIQYCHLNVILMVTPNDSSKEGKTSPRLFPASCGILDFCDDLQENRDFRTLHKLPKYMKSNYTVCLHKLNSCLENANSKRGEYFSDIDAAKKQILFLDPDIGFEPEIAIKNHHIKYSDMKNIWEQILDDTVVVVFQHNRRCRFALHYDEIKKNLNRDLSFSWDSTALFWSNKVMFIIIGKCKKTIGLIRQVNKKYKNLPRPVQIINEN